MQKDILKLHSRERKLVKTLLKAESPMSISDLARITRLPRTSIYTQIDNLAKRGVIMRRKHGREVLFRIADEESTQPFFDILGRQEKDAPLSRLGKFSGVTVCEGVAAMLKNVNRYLVEHPAERVFAIQTAEAWSSWIAKLGQNQISDLNRAIRENKIVFETIVPENFIQDLYKKHGAELLQSYFGRATRVYVVPAPFFHFQSDVLMTNQRAFLMDWSRELGIIIENKAILDLLRSVFQFLQSYSKVVDIHKEIRVILQTAS